MVGDLLSLIHGEDCPHRHLTAFFGGLSGSVSDINAVTILLNTHYTQG